MQRLPRRRFCLFLLAATVSFGGEDDPRAKREGILERRDRLVLLADEARGRITTIAGTGRAEGGAARGPALKTNIGEPFGVEIGPDGALYVTEVGNHRVRRLDLKSGELTTIAGCGKKGYSGDGGPATQAELNEPYEVRFDKAGNMYFVEMQNHIVRVVDAKTKTIRTLAGTGKAGFAGDGGPATKAEFRQPHSIALDDSGNVYVADIGNHRIRRIDAKSGMIDSIAGNGEKQMPQDGEAAKGNPVFGPRSLCLDGNALWVCLREGNSVWRLDLAKDRWRHVAGTGKQGFTGDGGLATEATFAGPKGIALGPDRALYVADTENQAIRRIDLESATIGTIAGSGPKPAGPLGDGGEAIKAVLARPHGVCVGPDGAVYIGDTNHHRVRRVRP
jgi:DNA-binding beta-propeller fold protein YncE